jgi:hypothetical protein
MDLRWAGDDINRIRALAQELVGLQPDIIVSGTAAPARTGACAYLAAWDVHRAKLFGRCERKTGIVPFDRLVAQVMGEEP